MIIKPTKYSMLFLHLQKFLQNIFIIRKLIVLLKFQETLIFLTSAF